MVHVMSRTISPMTIIVSLIGIVLLCIAIIINAKFYHYKGNNYIPLDYYQRVPLLLLMLLGSYLHSNSKTRLFYFLLELMILFGVILIIILMTNAVQYSPFSLVDHYIATFDETIFRISVPDILAWVANYPEFKKILWLLYSSLEWQMAFIPIICIILQKVLFAVAKKII